MPSVTLGVVGMNLAFYAQEGRWKWKKIKFKREREREREKSGKYFSLTGPLVLFFEIESNLWDEKWSLVHLRIKRKQGSGRMHYALTERAWCRMQDTGCKMLQPMQFLGINCASAVCVVSHIQHTQRETHTSTWTQHSFASCYRTLDASSLSDFMYYRTCLSLLEKTIDSRARKRQNGGEMDQVKWRKINSTATSVSTLRNIQCILYKV